MENNSVETRKKINYSKKLFGFKKKILYSFFKRFFDMVSSLLALIVLFLPMLIIGMLVKFQDGGTVFFKQKRVGKNGKIFFMYKFRSMVPNAEQMLIELKAKNNGKELLFKLDNDPRITKFGRFLRRTSIDELPQLINILKGDMSVVGPRPCLISEAEKYLDEAYYRFSVPQGLTCLWQVSGRSDLPFEKQVELDRTYVNKRSLMYDFYLLLKTIPAVLTQKGAK